MRSVLYTRDRRILQASEPVAGISGMTPQFETIARIRARCRETLSPHQHSTYSFRSIGYALCQDMLSDGYKIQCLSAVKDSRMPSFVAETCMKEKYEPAKIECLSKMARGG